MHVRTLGCSRDSTRVMHSMMCLRCSMRSLLGMRVATDAEEVHSTGDARCAPPDRQQQWGQECAHCKHRTQLSIKTVANRGQSNQSEGEFKHTSSIFHLQRSPYLPACGRINFEQGECMLTLLCLCLLLLFSFAALLCFR